MYLISIYFDEKTEYKIRSYMKQIAKHTGNTHMLDGEVPPHITVAAFRTDSEEIAKELFENSKEKVFAGSVQWVSVGAFFPGSLHLTPVLNEYLHQFVEIYNNEAVQYEGIYVDERYVPFQWLPHTTIANYLSGEQMKKAFEVMRSQFAPFQGNVAKVGLAQTNPYRELITLQLKK